VSGLVDSTGAPETWLEVLAWAALGVACASSVVIAVDVWVRGHRQDMPVMEWVWPVTALYAGPVAVWGYQRFGRPKSARWRDSQGRAEPQDTPGWATYAVGVSHCGAGCTLGDIIAATAVFLLGLEIAGLPLWPEYIGDYTLAIVLGLGFQYFAIAPMRGLGLRDGLVAAAKADVLSLTAFEVGLFA
jgi:hypothetical protein